MKKKNCHILTTTMNSFTGIFFVIIGPSGVGKGSIINEIQKEWSQKNFIFPITATTRQPREGEMHNKDYIFMTPDNFKKGLKNKDFIEHAIVHNVNYYGLPKKEIFTALEKGEHVIRELDIQGLQNLQKIIPKQNLFSIFVMPPNIESLENRIRKRSNLPEEEIERRLNTAKEEIKNAKICDFIITSENNKLREAVINTKNQILLEIIKKEEQDNLNK